MAKLITTVLFLISALSFSQTAKTGFYFLAEKASDGLLVNDLDAENTFAVEKIPFLSTEDFEKVKIVTLDYQPYSIKAIKIHLTKESRKTWREAKKRLLQPGESIVFVYNNTVYHRQFMYGNATSPNSYIELIIDEKYIKEISEGLN